jgi:hypothetical protein
VQVPFDVGGKRCRVLTNQWTCSLCFTPPLPSDADRQAGRVGSVVGLSAVLIACVKSEIGVRPRPTKIDAKSLTYSSRNLESVVSSHPTAHIHAEVSFAKSSTPTQKGGTHENSMGASVTGWYRHSLCAHRHSPTLADAAKSSSSAPPP